MMINAKAAGGVVPVAETPQEKDKKPAVGISSGVLGVTQPYQLLKYSAISRCGMVLK